MTEHNRWESFDWPAALRPLVRQDVTEGASRHDECMVQTFALEVELFGQPMSPSVLDRVRRLDEHHSIRRAIQYGGSRAIAGPLNVRKMGYSVEVQLDHDGTPMHLGERMVEVRPGEWMDPLFAALTAEAADGDDS